MKIYSNKWIILSILIIIICLGYNYFISIKEGNTEILQPHQVVDNVVRVGDNIGYDKNYKTNF